MDILNKQAFYHTGLKEYVAIVSHNPGFCMCVAQLLNGSTRAVFKDHLEGYDKNKTENSSPANT